MTVRSSESPPVLPSIAGRIKKNPIYPKEIYFEFGFVGGSREGECKCEKGDLCTSKKPHSGFNIYEIRLNDQKMSVQRRIPVSKISVHC